MSLNLVPTTPLSMVELISAWLSGPVLATSVSRVFRSASVLVPDVCQVNSVAVVAMMRPIQLKRRGGWGNVGTPGVWGGGWFGDSTENTGEGILAPPVQTVEPCCPE